MSQAEGEPNYYFAYCSGPQSNTKKICEMRPKIS